jgi:hypothetical protein
MGVNDLEMNSVVTFALVMKNNYVYHDCFNMLLAEEVHSGDERPRSQELRKKIMYTSVQ